MVPLALWGFPWHRVLHMRESGRQQVLMFPMEGVLLALARESHPRGLVSVSRPRDLLGTVLPWELCVPPGKAGCWDSTEVFPSPGPSLSVCPRAFWILPCLPGLCLSGSRLCAWLSLAVGCSLCGMTARAWVFLAPLHLFQAKVWAGISLPGKRSSFHRVSGRAFPTFRAALSPLAFSV